MPIGSSTVTLTSGSSTVTGASTTFLTTLRVGDIFSSGGFTSPIASITLNTSMTLDLVCPASDAGASKAWAYAPNQNATLATNVKDAVTGWLSYWQNIMSGPLGTLANVSSFSVSLFSNTSQLAWQSALGVSKVGLGLGNVDNTSDANKPVSTATNAVLALKANLSGATFIGPVVSSNGALYVDAISTGNSHYFLRDNTGNVKALFYFNAAGNFSELGNWAIGFRLQHGSDGVWRIGIADVHHDGNASRGAPDWVLEDQKASGTSGGTALTSFVTRNLNTKVRDPLGLVSLSANQFTSTVSGWVEFNAPHHAVSLAMTRLWNVTDGVVVGNGGTANSGVGNAPGYSQGGGAVIAGKTYRIESRSASSRATDGFGQAHSMGGPEVYARVLFWRS